MSATYIHAVPVSDDMGKPRSVHEDDESATEVESALMKDEGRSYGRLQRRRDGRGPRRRSRHWQIWSRVVELILLSAILALLAKQAWDRPSRNPHNFGGDVTGFVPAFPQQVTKFEVDYDYVPKNSSEFFDDPKVLERWNALLPKGMGFQWMKEPEKYHDLPHPIVWYEGMTVFTTSVTHQIHCLWAMAQTYSGLKAERELPDDHHWHMTHCFSYLRQAILCSADVALEGLETTFPDHNGGSDGWDSKHVCRDYGQVREYLESVRAYDAQEIF